MTCQQPGWAVLTVAAVVLGGEHWVAAQGRLPLIRQRGALVCGVAPGVAGFARVDERGRYSGLETRPDVLALHLSERWKLSQ